MTVPETEPVHTPQSPETRVSPIPGAAPPLSVEDRARGTAATRDIGAARRQIESDARKGVEALLAQHPEAAAFEVGDLARLAATRISIDLVAGTVPGSQLHYAAQAVRTLVEVARLEAGKPTDVTARITAGANELAELLGSVRRDARAVIDGAATGGQVGDGAPDSASEAGDEA